MNTASGQASAGSTSTMLQPASAKHIDVALPLGRCELEVDGHRSRWVTMPSVSSGPGRRTRAVGMRGDATDPTIARMRIVSLLPSATEILFDLGLGDEVVGVTFECNWPAEARTKRIVSTSALPEGLTPAEIDVVVKERMAAGEDLYRLDRGALADIDPELVVTQDLCAVCAVDVSEVDDAIAYLGLHRERADARSDDARRGDRLGRHRRRCNRAPKRARPRSWRHCGDRVASRARARRRPPTAPVLVLEWTDPAFTAGHWVPDLVEAAGGTCLLGRPARSRRASSGTDP